ncbi:MAG: Gfo/Idh/MocA family oxidoreductase [Bacteroidales bacterium]|nr:Gfo/Idh/MocA family oxidoreductase [Bacteroidales bacterium]MDD4602307.1 Gfo/Idh/MocA family oxidoreductase [Bacteroidales bacterium]
MDTTEKPLNFALIGAAGYVAPRHMKAIRDTGNKLICALDPYDGVGIIDSYFPKADFFIEPERFDRHLDKLRREALSKNGFENRKVDYVSICSPNYMHDSHIRLALRNNAHAICEKPIVLNPWNLDALQEIEKETGKSIYTILQLRLHPTIRALYEEIKKGSGKKMYDLDLTYITSRGNWYDRSWKGDVSKSGGIATNIGVHFFDMLSWIFGTVKENIVHLHEKHKAAGLLRLENANIRWFLSIDYNDIPENIRNAGKRTYRSLTMGDREIEFSEGFTDLHTDMYREILAGRGFGLKDASESIRIVYQIRNEEPVGLKGDYHPILKMMGR